MSQSFGVLYVVATPIGNLADFSQRAIDTLQQVDLICAEDTRHARTLLQHYGINSHCIALHQHNEAHASEELIAKLQQGLSIAIISDAGTPLISDPGMPLVTQAHTAGISVTPIPGACALISALSAAGLPTSQFSFLGFLPRTSNARQSLFQAKKNTPETWVFYESCHRIVHCLHDLIAILEPEREITIAREITKLHETIIKAPLSALLKQVEQEPNMQRGEFVVMISGAHIIKNTDELEPETLATLKILLNECTIKTAVNLAVKLTGARKKLLYQTALELAERS